MEEFKLLLISAERLFYNGPCVSLVIPAFDGSWGIMAHHAEMVTALNPGELRYTTPDGATTVVASGPGFALVNNRDVVVLVDTIERPEEIDANRARREYEEAQEDLRQKQSQKEHRMTEMALAKALGRLQVKDHYR